MPDVAIGFVRYKDVPAEPQPHKTDAGLGTVGGDIRPS